MPIRLPFRFRQALSLGYPLVQQPLLASARRLSGSPISLAQRAGKSKSSSRTSSRPPNPSTAQSLERETSEPSTSTMSGRSYAPPKRRPNQRRGPPPLPGGLLDQATVLSQHPIKLPHKYTNLPKDVLNQYITKRGGAFATYKITQGEANGKIYYRATALSDALEGLNAIGDGFKVKDAEYTAALSAVLQLAEQNILQSTLESKAARPVAPDTTQLSDGSELTLDRAKFFMDYYCHKFDFSPPTVDAHETRGNKWEAILTVGGRRIGIGQGLSKKDAEKVTWLDAVKYLEECDTELWKTFLAETKGKGDVIGLAPPIFFNMRDRLYEDLRHLTDEVDRSTLFANRPKEIPRTMDIPPTDIDVDRDYDLMQSSSSSSAPSTSKSLPRRQQYDENFFRAKSSRLTKLLESYQIDPLHEKMRAQRSALPIYTRGQDVIDQVNAHEVTVCMAATGSGKTTQIPQIILDDWIAQGKGSKCNIICTQPRRIAAISVAQRVANERGETVGNHVGYQVRFDAKLPQPHGSITFCTTGIFLKRMQTALNGGGEMGHDDRSMDDVTHIVIDEVHERDVDTDLTLVVLKRLLADRRARGKPLKVILMSATIDPTLFQTYYADADGNPAKVIDIPGRSFPVEKKYLDEIVKELGSNGVQKQSSWIFHERNVTDFLNKEIGPHALTDLRGGALALPVYPSHQQRGGNGGDGRRSGTSTPGGPLTTTGEELEIPYPLVALTIAHVLKHSDSGHVLVFLPGWDEMMAVQKIMNDPHRFPLLDMKLNDPSKYSTHLLHSSVPVADQQAVFEPAAEGIRRIILATNIAETSITIPDVVYVVDSGKVKEKRYDPERHMSSLVSAWVGSSNLNQRAGRAGRHRPGQYYGILSQSRLETLDPYQLVEMKRVDLSNVVMHVKALDFAGMEVTQVLAALIEPPAPERVSAALNTLLTVGALDHNQNLTSLGRVLLQLPVEAAIGRLVLFGCLFKCLDQALTLAAVLTNRDPFMCPPALKQEAQRVKASWSPTEFQSDALATVRAFTTWWEMQSRGDYHLANRFASDNFLSKPTMLLMQQIKMSLLESLFKAGVVEVSAGGKVGRINQGQGMGRGRQRPSIVPPELNTNGDSLPLLAGLIAIASQPNFAVRMSDRIYRTSQDKTTFVHPSSVNNTRGSSQQQQGSSSERFEKYIVAFAEKVRNISVAQSGPAQTFLRTTTRLDPMTYVLFGAYDVKGTDQGLECDDWLPITGRTTMLHRVKQLKESMDACMLRVFEGINNANSRPRAQPQRSEDAIDDENDDAAVYDDIRASPLSSDEVLELDFLTRDIVRVLEQYSEDRMEMQSRRGSRPATPLSLNVSPSSGNIRLPNVGGSYSGARQLLGGFASGGGRSGDQTPYRLSRPGTPSGLRETYSRP